MIYTRSRLYRSIAATLLVCLLGEIVVPATAYALTSGPTQPEFSSFEPVSTSGMVNEFTGGFTYNLPVVNIPGPNGAGYAMSLSYHSNPSPEEEASWVGYGWTLNPGAINRMKRGFPDDYKETPVKYWNRQRTNWTTTVTKRAGMEFFSFEDKTVKNPRRSNDGSGSLFITQRYNNYMGYGYARGFNLSMAGIANVGFTESDGKSYWSFNVNPYGILTRLMPAEGAWAPQGYLEKVAYRMATNAISQSTSIGSSTGAFGLWMFNDYTMPTNTATYEGKTWTGSAAFEYDPLPFAGFEVGFEGTFSSQTAAAVTERDAYGYMYSGPAADDSYPSGQVHLSSGCARL